MDSTSLGDRMKQYEASTDARLLPELPIIIRLDGRSFSKFTKGMERPFDDTFREAMINTAKYLVLKYNPKIAYTQSDEITLVLHQDSLKQDPIFNARVQKICSVFASSASTFFLLEVMKLWPEKLFNLGLVNGRSGLDILEDLINPEMPNLPEFDCRVFAIPSKMQAYNALLWREQDATKNSILMVSQHAFGHKAILGINTDKLQYKLLTEKDINWNDFTSDQKRGTYIRKERKLMPLEKDKLDKIPEAHRPKDGMIERNMLTIMDMPPIQRVTNAVEMIFNGDQPICGNDS